MTRPQPTWRLQQTTLFPEMWITKYVANTWENMDPSVCPCAPEEAHGEGSQGRPATSQCRRVLGCSMETEREKFTPSKDEWSLSK
jgi:hypothetical protein